MGISSKLTGIYLWCTGMRVLFFTFKFMICLPWSVTNFRRIKNNQRVCWNLVKVDRNLFKVYGNARIIFCIQIDWTPYHDKSQIFVKLKINDARVGFWSKLSGIYSMCTSCVCLSIFRVIFFKNAIKPIKMLRIPTKILRYFLKRDLPRFCVYPPRFCVIFLKETYQDFALFS